MSESGTTTLTTRKKAAAERLERIHQVAQWILSAASEHEITQAIEAQWPAQKSRPLIASAMARIGKDGDGDPATFRAWAIEATKLIHKRALEAGDLATALRAIRQIVEFSK